MTRRAGSRPLVAWGPAAIFVGSPDPDESVELLRRVRRAARRRQLPPVREVVPGHGGVLLDGVADLTETARTLTDLLRADLLSSDVREEPSSDSAVTGEVAEVGRRRDLGRAAVDDPVVLPTLYEGPDLEVVARLWGCSPEAVVARHLATGYRVAFVGFAPGFGYLVGDPPLPETPRRSAPRPAVPAGAVGVAGPYSGVYPRVSPGGWQLIGWCLRPVFDVTARPPALLRPGSRVRFVLADRHPGRISGASIGGQCDDPGATPRQVDAAGLAREPADVGSRPAPAGCTPLDRAAHRSEPPTPWSDPPGGVADVRGSPGGGDAPVEESAGVLCVVRAGALTTVQDRGRPGLAHLGVPASGAVDVAAAALANRLLGNPRGAATLETTLDGVGLVARSPCRVVVTGAPAPVTVDGRAAPYGEPIVLRSGAHLEVGRPCDGVRSYLGVAGGVVAPPVLGSRSHDRLSGLGPAPLADGDLVPVGRPRRPRFPAPLGFGLFGSVPTGGPAPLGPASGVDIVVWRPMVLAGAIPRGAEWAWPFDRAADRAELGDDALWCRVGAASSRIGVVLERVPGRGSAAGGVGTGGAGAGRSFPLPTGAVELLPSGGVVVFLADRPTTGGYPLLGAIDDRGRQLLAQTPVGTTVRLHFVVRSG